MLIIFIIKKEYFVVYYNDRRNAFRINFIFIWQYV